MVWVLNARRPLSPAVLGSLGAGPLAVVCEALWRAAPLPGQPPLTRFPYWASSQECTIDISKAGRDLGYRPVKGRAEGLAELRAAGAC
jgi:nucleoside-diphosphate-sugar epimerase